MKNEEEYTKKYLNELEIEAEKERVNEDNERRYMYDEDIWIQLKFLNGEEDEYKDMVYKPREDNLSNRIVERGLPKLELNQTYSSLINTIENNYITNLLELFGLIRSINFKCVNHYDSVRMAYVDFVKRVHNKQELVNEAITKFNKFPIDLRINVNTKYELHQLVTDLNNELWKITEQRQKENSDELYRIRNDDWISDEITLIIQSITNVMQV